MAGHKHSDPQALTAALLGWYDRHARVLPWRTAAPDPYRVWLSEIMLQQTTVVTVAPYFQNFVVRWPTVAELAAADLDDVLRAWAGLGYYARARNLHKCAQTVVADHGGRFPDDEATLRTLPGIGAYTAAAIAAIAFDRPATPVEGNVERVMARLYAVKAPLPGAKARLRELAAAHTPAERPGDAAQAMMDLGATVCTPRKPNCLICPWVDACQARAQGIAQDLPARTPKPERPTRRGIAFWAVRGDGAVLLFRRPTRGLLGGMMEVPSSDWMETLPRDAMEQAPFAADWQPLPGLVRHTFTHFHLELVVMAARAPDGVDATGRWIAPDALSDQALPSVMKKVVRHALAHV